MARPDVPGAVLDAVHYMEVLAKAGVLPDAIATEATAMAVQPWFQGCGEPHPRRLVANDGGAAPLVR